jgi:hypothetical protein
VRSDGLGRAPERLGRALSLAVAGRTGTAEGTRSGGLVDRVAGELHSSGSQATGYLGWFEPAFTGDVGDTLLGHTDW